MKYILIALLCVFINVVTFAEPSAFNEQAYKFTNLNTDDGLSSDFVTTTMRDSKGMLWIGTGYGLNLYDGYSVQVFLNNRADSTSLPDNFIQVLYEDYSGNIWVGTKGGGACLYNAAQRNFIRFDIGKNCTIPGLSFTVILDIIQAGEACYFATEQGGMVKYTPGTGGYEYFWHDKSDMHSLSSNCINSIVHEDNYLWLGSGGIYIDKFNIQTNHSERIEIDGLKQLMPVGEQRNSKTLTYNNATHNLWIANINYGLWVYKTQSKTFTRYNYDNNALNNNSVQKIVFRNNEAWVATDNGGVNIIKNDFLRGVLQANAYNNFSISSNGIIDLNTDKEGNLYVATFDAGLNIYTTWQNEIEYYYNIPDNENSITHNNVTDIAQTTDGTIWVATDGGGLNIFHPGSKSFTRFVYPNSMGAINNNYITSLYADGKNNLYVAAYLNGFSIYNTQSGGLQNYKQTPGCENCPVSNNTWSFYYGNNNILWMGNLDHGISAFNTEKGRFVPLSSISDVLWPLSKFITYDITGHGNKIYFTTLSGGLQIFDQANDTLYRFLPTSDSEDKITRLNSLAIDTHDNIWIGSENGLISMHLPTLTDNIFTRANGLPSNNVFDIIVDNKNRKWVSTIDGLCVLNSNNQHLYTWPKNNNLFNNTPNNTSCLYDNDGYIYFGGNKGLHRFHPDSISFYNYQNDIVLTGFQINNIDTFVREGKRLKHINAVSELHLNSKSKVFSIAFAVPNIQMNQQIQYKYKLEGFNNTWLNAGNSRKATFTGLKGGSYTFKVRSTNTQGQWVNNTRSLKIIIHPPFYKSDLFFVLIVFIIIGLLIALYRLRIKFIRKQSLQLKELVKQRTQQLKNSYTEIKEQNHEIAKQRDLAHQQKEQIIKQNSELELHRNHLEYLVESRTRELIEAKERAERADKLKSSFLSNLSHEIRTPMNAILGFMDLLVNPLTKDDEKKEYVDSIYHSSYSLLNVIDDIIDIAKIESGDISIHNEAVDVNLIFEELNQLYINRLQNSQSQVKLNIQSPPEKIILQTDEKRLKQILHNLIDNAIKFTEKGCVEVKCTTTDKFAIFSVKDTGIGIKQKELEVIFDRFYKIEEEKTKLYRGTGLGLSICKQLVEKFNGKIWVESEPGKGTTFFFSVPDKKREQQAAEHVMPENIDLKRAEILIAEDDDYNYQYLATLLKRCNAAVIRANDGREAIELYNCNKNIKAIFMDIKMPVLDGLKATAELRASGAQLPIIAQTAFALSEDRVAAIQAGCNDHISKPINKEELYSKIKKYLLNV